MNKFQVGYAQVNINPPLGIGVEGYYIPRFAKGFLDDLEASALALSCSGKKIVMISVDCCFLENEVVKKYSSAIEEATGLSKENIFIAATHTHTAALLAPTEAFEADEEMIRRYAEFVCVRLIDAVKLALEDLKPAKMGYIVGYAPERVAYIRRYKMKDGTTWTCPPINDPNIEHPIGELDQRVNVLRFDREGAHSVVLVNYGLHADTVNGDLLSADWPGWMRKTVEKALDGTKCMFFAGAQGDVGSTNIHPKAGDMNDTEISFDNEMKSPGMARFVGRALAGTVLQVYDKVAYVDVDEIKVLHHVVSVPANVPEPEQLPLAHKYKELHEAGRDEDIPFTAMELTTVVAEAVRMCRLEHGPEVFELDLMGVQIGPVAFVGIPGEPFTDIGVDIKDTEGWDMILPCALTNGYLGYFPMKSAFDEGGYEARSSSFKSGVGEAIIAGGKELLKKLSEHKRVTRSDVKEAVEKLGISKGDIVLVHSSMKSLGYVEGGPEAVIKGILDVIGPEGTLVMPTLSQKNFENVYKDWSLDRPSDVGLLTEVFRKYSGAMRSDQATHSVAALGALAQEITEGHTAFGPRFGVFGDYAFSYSSPWQKMYDRHAKVVFIGVNMRCNTFRHFAEYRFVEKQLKQIEGVPGGDTLKNRLKHFENNELIDGIWPYMPGPVLHEAYIEAGLVERSKCGEAEFLCMPVYECVEFLDRLLEIEPQKWVSEEVQTWLNDVKELVITHGTGTEV